MIDINNLSFGQRIDVTNWLVEPWWTHGALDEFKTWDLKIKKILEFGAGASSFWLANKCKRVISVEANQEWYDKIEKHATRHLYENLSVLFRPCNEGDQTKIEYYTHIPDGYYPDIIINDGVLRTEVCQMAVDYFKINGGGILICDNWIQSYVWMSPKAEEIMKPFRSKIFEQADHKDNDGINKWKTAIFYIE